MKSTEYINLKSSVTFKGSYNVNPWYKQCSDNYAPILPDGSIGKKSMPRFGNLLVFGPFDESNSVGIDRLYFLYKSL